MRSARSYGYSGMLALFVFACLLLAGSQRLIASSDLPKDFPDLSGKEAWFCAAPTTAQEHLPDRQTDSHAGRETCMAVACEQWKQQAEAFSARCDANGNVLLGRKCYIKAVYQAFPLGDGFA